MNKKTTLSLLVAAALLVAGVPLASTAQNAYNQPDKDPTADIDEQAREAADMYQRADWQDSTLAGGSGAGLQDSRITFPTPPAPPSGPGPSPPDPTNPGPFGQCGLPMTGPGSGLNSHSDCFAVTGGWMCDTNTPHAHAPFTNCP